MRCDISVPTSEGASGNGWWRLGCWICPVRKEGRVLRLCEGDIVGRSVCVFCFGLMSDVCGVDLLGGLVREEGMYVIRGGTGYAY